MTSTGRAPVTVVIAAHNEAANIQACLASVSWAAEAIVVENDSTDGTAFCANEVGATVISPPFTTIGHARNAGIAMAAHPWVLVLDADERCSPELADELHELAKGSHSFKAFRIPRRNFFLGREIKHGGWERDRPLRFFPRTLRYDDKKVHEGVRVEGAVGETHCSLLHYTYASLDAFFEKLSRYSRDWAEQNFAKGRRVGFWSVLLRGRLRFASMYLLKLGFLDGAHGLILARLAEESVMAKYARLWEMTLAERAERVK
ncbi:MAG: glycosyltransferase family 2 protein [Gemmatimonadaceae bacterium]|nr:glycosyltransferase family 2 protein [Gemmatimonadaceae bacterium]